MPPPAPSTKKLLTEIRSLIESKDYDGVIEKSRSLLVKDPSNYHANVYIGVAATAQKDFHLALESFESAIDLKPELPLAYKGVVQTLSKASAPSYPLRLARAHYGLGSHSADHAEQSLLKAADIFFDIGLTDPDADTRNEAVSAICDIREKSKSFSSSNSLLPHFFLSYADILTYRICKLLSLGLPPKAVYDSDRVCESSTEYSNARYDAMHAVPMASALDELEEILSQNNHPFLYHDSTAQLVIERASERCLRNHDFEKNITLLSNLQAYDAFLHASETDHALTFISKEDRALNALRSVHLTPFNLKKTRAKAILATLLMSTMGDSDLALRLTSASTSSSAQSTSKHTISRIGVKVRKVSVFHSCTHAFVAAWLHYTHDEFKKSIEACKAGQLIISKQCQHVQENMKRMYTLFSLIISTALCGDRKYKDALKEYESVRRYAHEVNDEWMSAAANQGLIHTAIIGHGRKSHAASIVMEDAATDATAGDSNINGMLECAWSDALTGDVDVNRMQELMKLAIDTAKTAEEDIPEEACFEYAVLDSRLKRSRGQVAAMASTRLGQMTLKAVGYDDEVALADAQKCHMQAAGLAKGSNADPFAHLGFIFEQKARINSDEKMMVRAMRCYERALAIDAAHPVASRRLVRLLMEESNGVNGVGMWRAAVDIGKEVSERNPKARWAFNLLGWWKLANGDKKGVDAGVMFQSALRGRPPRWSAKEEDSVFGTNVAATTDDNDLLIDVDSWRGLAVAYRLQGKVGAASACLQNALEVMEKPPPGYAACLQSVNMKVLLGRCRTIVETERDVLAVLSRKAVNKDVSLLVSGIEENERQVEDEEKGESSSMEFYAAETLMLAAAEEWVRGAYRRAMHMRQRAGKTFEAWIERQVCREASRLNYAVLYKRLGDMWMEVAGGESVKEMASSTLVSRDFISDALQRATMAYSRAGHLAPWDTGIRAQDIAAVLQRRACLDNGVELAGRALDVLLTASMVDDRRVDMYLMAMGLLTVASISDKDLSKKRARELARRVLLQDTSSTTSIRNAKLLDASLAVSAITTLQSAQNESDIDTSGSGDDDDLGIFAEAAVRATRSDPTDWRGFYAVASVREADARRSEWMPDKTQSCEEAYGEADRLGAGPAAVMGRLRCLERLLLSKRRQVDDENGWVATELFEEACYVSAVSKRVGADVPHVCIEIANNYTKRYEDEVQKKTEELSAEVHGSSDMRQVWAHVHMFPFVPAVRDLLVVSASS